MFVSLRHTDPRALLLAAGGAAFVISALQSVAVSSVTLVLSAILSVVFWPPWRLLLKRLAAANGFLLFLLLTLPWTIAGENVFTLGFLNFSREGITLTALVTLKCNAIALVFITLTAGMDIPLVGYALEQLRLPRKLVFLFLFTCRYIHLIGEEWKKLQTATALRGFIPRTSLHTYKTVGSMLGLTIMNSVERSRKIYEAMLMRGFVGQFFTLTEFRAQTRDIVFVLFFFLILLCLLGADVTVCRYA